MAVAAALFLLVFSITEGATYGWLSPTRAFTIGGTAVWPTGAPVSVAAAAFMLAAAAAIGFVAIEYRKERSGGEPLVALSDFRLAGFRFGLTTTLASVMAQAGTMFVLAVFLQTTHQLTAASAGLWLLPVGTAVLVGANVGGSLANRLGAATAVRIGITIQMFGVGLAAVLIAPDVTWGVLAPALAIFGFGAGVGMSQLWNLILSDVPLERAGSASGVATTNNSIAAALGVAVLGTVLRTAHGASSARWALLTAVLVLRVGVASGAALPRRRPTMAPDAAPEPEEDGAPLPGPAVVHAEARR
jgi:predicted MFS family arabinose efflux permease